MSAHRLCDWGENSKRVNDIYPPRNVETLKMIIEVQGRSKGDVFFFQMSSPPAAVFLATPLTIKKKKKQPPRFQREDLVSLYVAGEALKASSKLYKANRTADKLNTLHASARVMTPPAVVNVPVRAGGRLTGL